MTKRKGKGQAASDKADRKTERGSKMKLRKAARENKKAMKMKKKVRKGTKY